MKTISGTWLMLFMLASNAQAQQPATSPVTSLDTEHGVVMRLIQELDALKTLAAEGRETQRQSNELVLIDFEELADVFELIRTELQQSMKRKYGSTASTSKPGLF